jgi:hypothetical protein
MKRSKSHLQRKPEQTQAEAEAQVLQRQPWQRNHFRLKDCWKDFT